MTIYDRNKHVKNIEVYKTFLEKCTAFGNTSKQLSCKTKFYSDIERGSPSRTLLLVANCNFGWTV